MGRLKLQLQKAATENEILKATSAHPRGGSEPLPNAGPMRYSPTDFYTEVLYAHDNKTPSHRIVTSDSGERLLAAGATWGYIIKHPLYARGLVDIGDISERLKKVAKSMGKAQCSKREQFLMRLRIALPAVVMNCSDVLLRLDDLKHAGGYQGVFGWCGKYGQVIFGHRCLGFDLFGYLWSISLQK